MTLHSLPRIDTRADSATIFGNYLFLYFLALMELYTRLFSVSNKKTILTAKNKKQPLPNEW